MKVRMFKVSLGKEIEEGILECLSNNHAITICKDIKNKYGLIGRYYCETSTGFNFTV